MNTKLIFLLTIVSTLMSGQSYKAIYELQWKGQKEHTEYQKEYFALLISENSSDFLSYIKFKQDSTKTIKIRDYKSKNGTGMLNLNHNYGESKFNEIISKNYETDEINFQKQLYKKVFDVSNNCKLIWKINSEKSKISIFNAQKATTEFGGRKWNAWFSSDIPIPDGPYKFYGLPGLIIKISDSENEYIYELLSMQKENFDISERNFGNQKPIKINSDIWNKIWSDYKKDPSSIFGFEPSNDGWNQQYNIGGSPGDRGFADEYNERVKKFLKNFENPIELKNDCL